ncbi:MAG: hypothetical protein ACK4N5_22520, partial [Myxococcales bacterium]
EYKSRSETFKVPADKEFELRVNWTLAAVRPTVSLKSAAKKEPPPPPPDAAQARKLEAENAAKLPPPPVAAAPTNNPVPSAAVLAAQAPQTTPQVQKVWYRAGIIPWVATAVGLAAVGTGGYFSYRAYTVGNELANGGMTRADEAAKREEFNRNNRNAALLYAGGGGLAAGVDLYWLLSSAFAKDPEPETVAGATAEKSEKPEEKPAKPASASADPADF